MPISEALHIDNMKFMPGIPSKFFQIGIPDPPYGIKEDGRKTKGRLLKQDGSFLHRIDKRNGKKIEIKPKDYENGDWDNEIPSDEYFYELDRVCEHTIVWGANYFPSICGEPFKAPRRKDYDQFIKDHPTNWIIWDKVNGGSDFSDCELAWTSFPIETKVFYFMWVGMFQGVSISHGMVQQGNKALNEKRVHPTQKPLPLYQWQLQTFAKPGDKLYDSHMGAQGSRIAAWKMGYDYWGNEISERHYKDGCERFDKLTHEPLFQGQKKQ